MYSQIYVLLLLFSTTNNVLVAQIVNNEFVRRLELMANHVNFEYNPYFYYGGLRYDTKHGLPGTYQRNNVPQLRYQVPLQTAYKYNSNYNVNWRPHLPCALCFPSQADILRRYNTDYSHNRFNFKVPSVLPYIPKTYSNIKNPRLKPFDKGAPYAIKNQFRNNNNDVPLKRLILPRLGSTSLSDIDKKTEIIYSNNNEKFDFVHHLIEKMLTPSTPIEKKVIDSLNLQERKVVSTTEHTTTSVVFTFVPKKRTFPETDDYVPDVYVIDEISSTNNNVSVSKRIEMNTSITTENNVGSKACCANEEFINYIHGHVDTEGKLLKEISTTKEIVGPYDEILILNKSPMILTQPINEKVTTPTTTIENVSETMESLKVVEKQEPTMEVTSIEAYNEIDTIVRMDDSETNTIDESTVTTTPTLNTHFTARTEEYMKQTVTSGKLTTETFSELVTEQEIQLEELEQTEINTIQENNTRNFTIDRIPITGCCDVAGVTNGIIKKLNIHAEGEIHSKDNGSNSSEYWKIRARRFVNSLEQLDRKFHKTNFNILSALAPVDRRENGISFLQSGFLLLVSLSALATTVDEQARDEIANFSRYDEADQEKAVTIASILQWLPKTDANLTIRWSNRLVLAPGYNLTETFWRGPAKDMRMHVDFLNNTSDPAVLANTINYLVEKDSGGAMRDDTFYEAELSDVRCVLLSTLYVRGRWRVGPTLLNGTRRFYDDTDDVRSTPMVRINDVVRYAHVERWDADAVEICYATAGLKLLVLVPRGRSLRPLTGHVTAEGLRHVIDSMVTRRIAVTLPVYTLRMSLLLPNKLQKMGVKTLLKGHGQQIRLSHAIQRIMYWSEAGRNAFKDDGLEWDESPDMELLVDRPYLFFVRWHNITLLNGNFVL